jgi:predicted nucleic-acid-binding protein
MIGIDTNVLLRAIVGDDLAQQKKAAKFLKSQCSKTNPGFINLLVLGEVVWTLDRGYRYDRAQIGDVIEALLSTAELVVERQEDVAKALLRYRQSNIGFADVLIATVNARQGCSTTVTLDRKAAKRDGFKLLA